ncbi:aquaporin [Balneola sp. MJW-20]|uniref:aquaporin n=1 Tax=Gracilimonas aurantiaca TaxID=3234185 RepID=UPI0034660371
MRELLMETVGTFFLVLAIGLTGDIYTIGIILTAVTYLGYNLSGSHFNPIISFALYLRKEIRLNTFLFYTLSQFTGAFLAFALIYYFAGTVFYMDTPSGSDVYQQVVAEALFAFLFTLVFIYLQLSPRQKHSYFNGIIIGITFSGVIALVHQISGGYVHPFVFLGSAAVDLVKGGNSYELAHIFTIPSLTGATIAAWIYSYLKD